MNFLAISIVLFLSISAHSQAFNVDDIGVVKSIIERHKTSDKNDPIFIDSEPKKVNLDRVIDHIWNLLETHNIKGGISYSMIMAILMSPYGYQTKSELIKSRLQTYELNSGQIIAIEKRLKEGPDTSTELNGLQSNQINQDLAFRIVKGIIKLMPISSEDKVKMVNGVSEIRNIIIPSEFVDNCYNNNPECMYSKNQGIIAFFSDLITKDEEFLIDAINFYTELYLYGKDLLINGKDHYYDISDFNSWDFAMKITEHNPLRAIRVISLFGHDDCCNDLNSKDARFKGIVQLFENLRKQNGKKLLYKPGALGGAWVQPEILSKIKYIENRFAKDVPELSFRATYYHLIGGAFSTSELLRRGYGIISKVKFPLILSEGLGYSYKKATTSIHFRKDAKKLWKQIGGNLKLCPIKPVFWSESRYKKALSEVELAKLYVIFTQQKHRAGAEFIWSEFYKYKFGYEPLTNSNESSIAAIELEESEIAEKTIKCLSSI